VSWLSKNRQETQTFYPHNSYQDNQFLLQESYKQLEALKQKLETKEAVWRSNMTDSQKETDLAKQEVRRSPRGKQPIMGGRLRQSGVTKPTLKSVPSDPKLSSKVSVYIDVVGRFFRFV
jgi:hypothetical protein